MTAVIYARYSSDNQREESIEGQIRECTAYAEKNGITVIKHYIDRAFSAKTDNRPEFQQMIKDSGKKLFDVVLVWKFDRFARNRFDSANYKMILKKNGVHLISVMEPIAEGSQGILVETLLEGMAEYYSAELSEKVIRGQTENALKGKCTGGTGTIGYKIDDDKFYHLDPLTAPLVLEAFQRYDNGDKMVEIVNFLNDKGVRNMLGGKMTHSSVNTMLKNRRYIGELSFRDIVVPEAIPVIVPKDLFDRVQKRLDKNKRAPACGKADEEYLLTTKLFCGKCGALMFGESGTSATGRTYYYYKCANVKRRKGCNKKTVQKDWLEDLVVRETMKLIQDDAMIDKIVQLVMDVQNQENTTIPLLEKQLREVNKKLDNLMKAIEDGLYTRTTKERLEALESQKDELTVKIADEKLKKPSFNEDFIRFWLMKFRKFDISQKKQRKALIEIFVNAIFLYDDRMLITFNYKDGTQTVRFEDTLTADSAEEKSSDLSGSAGAARKGASGGWTLETLRNMALEQNFACAVVFLGGGSSIGEILENADLSQCGYVKEIPESRYVSAPDGGYELYCIVPAYGATLAVNEWVCNEGNGFVGETGQVLYRSDEADPILLFCNVSDIIPSTEVVITTRQGDVLDWNPCLSLQDGTVNTPWNLGGGVWDLTRYEKEPFEG